MCIFLLKYTASTAFASSAPSLDHISCTNMNGTQKYFDVYQCVVVRLFCCCCCHSGCHRARAWHVMEMNANEYELLREFGFACVNVCACAPFFPAGSCYERKICLYMFTVSCDTDMFNRKQWSRFVPFLLVDGASFRLWLMKRMVNGMAFEYSQYPVINTCYMDVGIMRGSTMLGVMQMHGLLPFVRCPLHACDGCRIDGRTTYTQVELCVNRTKND